MACVAEELALRAILLTAEEIYAEDHGVEGDFGWLWETGFQDNDYEFLFESENDGIEDTEYARRTGLTEIGFSSWFDGFNNTSPVHLYVEPDPAWWKRAPVPEDPDDDDERCALPDPAAARSGRQSGASATVGPRTRSAR